MIKKQDILDRAAEWQLRPDVVEKDYILGWLLAALASYDEMRGLWIFKGGTCIKKCYFETYRFSEDLDFSLLPQAPYTDETIRRQLLELTRIAYELSGVEFPPDLIEVRTLQDKLGRPTFQGRISYRGPLAIPTLPRVLFDITQHEPVLDNPVARPPLHPYPDALPDGRAVSAYTLNELLAEKTRALYERTRPRDLYDVVYLLENRPDAFELGLVREFFRAKCTAKQVEPPTADALLRVINGNDELRAEWENMLAHQLPSLPRLDDLLQRLPGLLRWVDEPTAMLPEVKLAAAPIPAAALISPPGIRYWGGGSPLEAIRFAGANRLLLEFDYDGKHRMVESYSLREAATGNILLYAWEQGGANIKAFNLAKMANVQATNVSFHPRYQVEFMPHGTLAIPAAAAPARRISSPIHRPRRSSARRVKTYGPTYIFECSYCGKRFRHSRNDPKLKRHKMKDGYTNCAARRGYLIQVK